VLVHKGKGITKSALSYYSIGIKKKDIFALTLPDAYIIGTRETQIVISLDKTDLVKTG
jgi:hypothetical protein